MSNQAIVIARIGNAQIQDVPYPELPAQNYLVVRSTAWAINPTDWVHAEADVGDFSGTRLGCDYAGVVEEIGKDVTRFAPGDRIAGFVNGANKHRDTDGAFGTLIAAKEGTAFKIPDNITDEEAAAHGVAITTMGQHLYQILKLPLPNSSTKDNRQILIYGGSTAMAITGIQLAKQSGLTVITTASPANADYVKSLGPDHVLNHQSPTLKDDILRLTNGRLELALDTVANAETERLCAEVMRPEGGLFASLRPFIDVANKVNPNIVVGNKIAYSTLGEPYFLAQSYDAIPEDYDFAMKFFDIVRDLLAEGKVKAPRLFVNRGGKGLEGVLVGLKEMKQGKVSGGKLVYTAQ